MAYFRSDHKERERDTKSLTFSKSKEMNLSQHIIIFMKINGENFMNE